MKFNDLFKKQPLTNILTTLVLYSIAFFALSADQSSDEFQAAKSTGSLIFSLLITLGAIKSFLLAKKATTSGLCVSGLGLVLLGWSITTLASSLQDISALIKGIFIVLGVLSLLIGVILAVVGLSLYKQNSTFEQGKSQAIWAIVVGLLFISIAGYGAVNAYQKENQLSESGGGIKNKLYEYENLNFKYTTPDTKYAELDKDLVNEDSTLLIKRFKPSIYFMLFAEKLGPETFNTNSLEKHVTSNLNSVTEEYELVSKKGFELNGMDGILLDINATVSNQKINYRYWVYEHNGYVYQLIGWGNQKKRNAIESEFEILISKFEMLSETKVALVGNKTILKSIESNLGIAINAEGTNWADWSDLEDDYPLALFGGEIGDVGYFQITPFCYGNNPPHKNAIRSALLYPFDVELDDEGITHKGVIKLGNIEIEQFRYQWQLDEGLHETRYNFIDTGYCTFLVSLWSIENEMKTEEYNNKLLNMLTFYEMERENEHIVNREVIATLFNNSGLFYYETKNYKEATKNFKLAILNDPTKEIYLNNVFDTLNKTNSYTEALQYVDSLGKDATLNAEGHSWLAWFFENKKNYNVARAEYETAFSSGFKNDDDLTRYVDLLLKNKELEKANSTLNQYAVDTNGVAIAVKKSEIKRELGDFEQALIILELAAKNKPLNSDIVFEKIYVYSDKGEYKAVIELAKMLISSGFESAGAHYQKGKAEYELDWYVQSKQSFKAALSFAPNNENIRDFLSSVNAMLGEGDSTSIDYAIKAVRNPTWDQKSQEIKIDAELFDSYFIEKRHVFEFRKGKKIKETKIRKIKILTNQGVKRFSTLEFDFDPLYERLYINQLEVVDENNQVLYTMDRNKVFVLDSEGTEANTNKTVHVPVANLAPGNIIKYTYTKESFAKAVTFPYTHLYHSSSRPVELSLIAVIGDVSKIDYESTNSVDAIKRKDMLIWVHENPEIYLNEPMQIHSSRFLPSISLNQKKRNWTRLAEKYLLSINDKLNYSEQVKLLAKTLTKNSANIEEKVFILSNYVQENVVYKALEFGVRGRIPNSASRTIDERYGDCKDHALLLWSLLNASGIEARLALVNLSEPVNPKFPSLDQFNHMVTYLPGFNNGQFIDTTDKAMDLTHRVPSGLGNAVALILQDKKSFLQKIPKQNFNDNRLISVRNISLSKDGKLSVKETFSLSGYSESSFRDFLQKKEPGKRQDWAKRFFSDLDKRVELKSMVLQNLNDNSQPLQIELEYEINNRSLTDGTIIFEDVALWEYYYILPSAITDRKTDFENKYPLYFESDITITYPPNYIVKRGNESLKSQVSLFGKYSIKTNINEGAISRRLVYTETSETHSKNKYQEYYQFSKKLLEELTSSLVFVPKSN